MGELQEQVHEVYENDNDLSAYSYIAILKIIEKMTKEVYDVKCIECDDNPTFKGLRCFLKAEGGARYTRFCPKLMNIIEKWLKEE